MVNVIRLLATQVETVQGTEAENKQSKSTMKLSVQD